MKTTAASAKASCTGGGCIQLQASALDPAVEVNAIINVRAERIMVSGGVAVQKGRRHQLNLGQEAHLLFARLVKCDQRASAEFLTNDEFKSGPNFADGADLYVYETQEQGDFPDGVLGSGGRNFGSFLRPRDPNPGI